MPTRAFARTEIDFSDNARKLLIRNAVKGCFLREIFPQQSIGIFVGSTLPR